MDELKGVGKEGKGVSGVVGRRTILIKATGV